MMWNVKDRSETTATELRTVFVNTLEELMEKNDKIIAIDADLGGASGFSEIRKNYPAQFLDVGIAEANMVGVAAGMSMRGFVPFIHSFSPFVSRRVGDQIYMSGAYSGNTINIFGSDPGICAASNGGTHTTFEDIALYRAIPETMVFDVADGIQLKWLIRELADKTGVHYIRGNRKSVPDIYEEGSTFSIGKGNIVKQGSQVLLISMGELLYDALSAADELEKIGISVEVIDMFTIKPLDVKLVKTETKGKRLVVTFENHSVINGLGSAVAEVLAEENLGVPFKRIGVNDRFGQVGDLKFLKKEYQLTKEHVMEVIEWA